MRLPERGMGLITLFVGVLALGVGLRCGSASAMQLPTTGWTVRNAAGQELPAAADNNPHTTVAITGGLSNAVSVVIDLGQTSVVHRVLITDGDPDALAYGPGWSANPSNILRVYAGDAADTTNMVGQTYIPTNSAGELHVDDSVYLTPTAGRYVRLEAPPQGVNFAWIVGELEVYGFETATIQRRDAVVLPVVVSNALRLAAQDLSYYLGELSGRAVPIITPALTNDYPDILYTIVDLQPLAPTWSQMTNNRAHGLLPENVNIERQGRVVSFKAWPYRCTLWSVWEFLEAQGVRWVYPGFHGDVVPRGRGVDLGILPLRYSPPGSRRYANFDLSPFLISPAHVRQNFNDGYLFFWRNRYESSWSAPPIDDGEMPADPYPLTTPTNRAPDYVEGFDGYPHNFNNVLPERILQAHTNWCGMLNDPRWADRVGGATNLGKRLPPSAGGPTFCMSDPEVIRFVVDKAIHVAGTHSSTAIFNLMPMDSAVFCECTNCMALCSPLLEPTNAYAGAAWFVASDAYYHFVNEVAEGIGGALPNAKVQALAYGAVYDPPRKIAELSSNVIVDVGQFGARGLPMDARRNAGAKAIMEAWHAKCATLQHYEYVLLDESATNKMPTPLVTSIAERARYLAGIGAINGGSQGEFHNSIYSPWNHYAYPRMLWNTNTAADQLLGDFFSGYFGEAKTPMLDSYRVVERNMLTNSVDLSTGVYAYGVVPGLFPVPILVQMKDDIQAAAAAATNWWVVRRVARAQEGLDWVIDQQALTGVRFWDRSEFPRVGSGNETLVLDLSTLRILRDYVQFTDGGLEYWGAGAAGDYVNFPKPDTYVVTVVARGELVDGAWPQMALNIEHRLFGPVTVATNQYTEYTFVTDLPAGVWQVLLKAPVSDGDRHLLIKEIRVSRAAPWYSQNWDYRQRLTIDAAALTNAGPTAVPVLIALDESNPLFGRAQTDGADLFFTAADGTTPLTYAIDRYDPATTQLWVWVMAPPAGSNPNVDLYVYYGNSATFAPDSAWSDTNWVHRQKLTITAAMVAGSDQTNFPALVTLSGAHALFTGAQTNGHDIFFTAADSTNRYPHEIEAYDPVASQLWAWVRIPLLSASRDTELFMYYGNPTCPSQQNPANVWDRHDLAVWHLNESPADPAPQMRDSTANARHGTCAANLAAGDFPLADCDDLTDWTGPALSSDASNRVEGTASLSSAVVAPDSNVTYAVVFNPVAPLDLGNRSLVYWLNCSQRTEWFRTERVCIYDTNGNWRWSVLPHHYGQTWWKGILHAASGGTASPTPPNPAAIDRIEWQFKTTNHLAGAFTLHLDNIYANGSLSAESQVAGKIGGALDFDWNDAVATTLNVSNVTGRSYTWSIWLKPRGSDSDSRCSTGANLDDAHTMGYGVGDAGIGFCKNNNSDRLILSSNYEANEWGYWVVVGDTNLHTVSGYVDGVGGPADPYTNAAAFSKLVSLGGAASFADAVIDEVRVSDIARSSNWIATCYRNMNDPGAYEFWGNENGFEWGTNTAAIVSVGAEEFVDTDDDDLSDGWERFYFGGLTNSNGACDSDGDGRSDLAEHQKGTDPLYIDMRTLAVTSLHGEAVPPVGTSNYVYGTTLSCRILNTPVVNGTTQYLCAGWTGSGSVPASGTTTDTGLFALTNNSQIAWRWQTQYRLATSISGSGTVTAVDGWYSEGSAVPLMASNGPHWHFLGWGGDTNGCGIAGNVITVVMDRARGLVARFVENLTQKGTPEWWLAQLGWTNAFDEAEMDDADQDGLLNWQEWIAGTEPTNRLSVLSVGALFPAASGAVLQWPSVSNRIYEIDRATNLILSDFEVLATNLAATPPMNVHTDQVPGADNAFYRITVALPENP